MKEVIDAFIAENEWVVEEYWSDLYNVNKYQRNIFDINAQC